MKSMSEVKKDEPRPKFHQDLLDWAFDKINGSEDEMEEAVKIIETYGYRGKPKIMRGQKTPLPLK